VKLNEESTVLITASYDQTVKCWDLRSSNRDPIETMKDFKDSVTSLEISEASIICGCVDGKVRIYDLRNGLLQTDDMYDPITCITLSEDKKTLLCNCLNEKNNGNLKLVEISTGKILNEYTGHQHNSLKIESKFENDYLNIISGSENGDIFHWNLLTSNIQYITNKAHSKGVSSIAYHPTKKMFLTSSYDGSVKVWNNEQA
jgi:mitogen-activated protein kinase organizer 1